MNKFVPFLIVLVLGGCAKNSSHTIDMKNSPCACNYSGEQLRTIPTDIDLKEIADLQFFEV